MQGGKQIDPRSYTTDVRWRPTPFSGTIDVERVAAEFEAGATIVLQALHHSWHPIAVFSRALESALGHPVQANAYYTPRSAQGLAVHHDTHDVFCLQVSGEKRWLVYEPVLELPLKHQRYSKELGGPGRKVEDVTLRPGDTLYLPRGWLHEALTSDSDSLHLTIGVNVYTWLDAFKAALDDCASEVGFRRSVPEGGELEADLLGALEAQLDPDAVARRRRERFVKGRRPVLPDQLEQLRALEQLTVETQLERRPTVIADLNFPTLSFEGKTLTFPGGLSDELEFIAAAGEPFTPADLPGDLDEDGRLVLVGRLVREGYLRIRAE